MAYAAVAVQMASFIISEPCGPWYQLASLCFICGGLFADLLIVRLMLTFAYSFMLANVLAGFPQWPRMAQGEPFTVSVDAIAWAALGLYVHGSSLCRLLYEERLVKLHEEEELVWRMFYRRARVSRLLFKTQILPGSSFRQYKPRELIADPAQPERLHLVIQGRADGVAQVSGGEPRFLRLVSGDLFEFRHLHLFGVPVGFIDQNMTVHARSHVSTFSIGVDRLARMASGSAPTRQAWLTVIIASLARAYERNSAFAHLASEEIPASEEASAAALDGWLDPAFKPLEENEVPPPYTPGSGACLWPWPLRTLAEIMIRTFSPPFPFHKGGTGLRHTAVNTEHDAKVMSDTTRFLQSVSWPSKPPGSNHGAQSGAEGYVLWLGN